MRQNRTADSLTEPDETFTLKLTSATNAAMKDPEGEGRILDHSSRLDPEASVGDVAVPEPFKDRVPAVFTVTLSKRATEEVRMDYATQDGTAKANVDYVPVSGTLAIPQGSASGKVTVQVMGDAIVEPTEDFKLNLSKPQNAGLAKVSGIGRILDAVPGLSIGDTTVVEGNADTTPAVFTVTNNAPQTQRVTADYATEPGTALPEEDFTPAKGHLAFEPGQNHHLVTVEVTADLKDEPDEDFSVRLANSTGVAIARQLGRGGIKDDDDPLTSGPGTAPIAAVGTLPGQLPPPQTIPSTQVQSQAQQQVQQQAQMQSQMQTQMQQQLQSQAQVGVQTGMMAERQKEAQVERAKIGGPEPRQLQASAQYSASTRTSTALPGAFAWLAGLLGLGLALGRRTPERKLSHVAVEHRRRPK